MMWDYGEHMSGWAWTVMGISMALFWVVIIAGTVFLVRYLGSTRFQGQSDRDLSASEILARRFARGEISEDEFRARSEVLKH